MKKLRKPMKRTLTCTCGSEHFAVLDESSIHQITADWIQLAYPQTLRIQCVKCGESMTVEGYQNPYYDRK